MNSVGRPKKEGLDKVIKVTVSENVAEMLDKTAKEMGKTKSELLREVIPIVSSRDFEEMLSNANMEYLQKYSDLCWETLHTKGCVFETQKLSEDMPAFLVSWSIPAIVYVKYPTFTIQIFDGKNKDTKTNQKEIEALLSSVVNKSNVSLAKTEYFVLDEGNVREKVAYVNQVTCLEIGLDANILCKNKIVDILREHGYNISILPAYYIRGIEVELLDEGKYFKIK